MTTVPSPGLQNKQGAEDSGRYFRYMAEFVGFTPDDAALVAQTRPHIEKRLPEIVTEFYNHLLRYPPTRKFFLKKDGSVDVEYVELRMRHLTNFWLRTASGEYDDSYARYVDYVGRAHTSRGADPRIYIAERYVIGQVGFISHAISRALADELRAADDEDFIQRALEAWDKLMMVILEMLARAYGDERHPETFEPLVPVPSEAVAELAAHAVEHELGDEHSGFAKVVAVAAESEIPEGERKIVHLGDLSIGVFHHKGNWYALQNVCLHQGGPVCTGVLEGDQLVCPWHGFRYDVTTGRFVDDPSAVLESYAVEVKDGTVYLHLPEEDEHAFHPSLEAGETAAPETALAPGEFRADQLTPGKMIAIKVGDDDVVVYNVGGVFYATQDRCTHTDAQLSEGDLDGPIVTCPIHGSCFDVTTGAVQCGPAKKPLRTYHVKVKGSVGKVVDR